ncbi:MAG TPA: DUF1361 domain-containing protein [Candidatus Izemoplasmatales bacterium]|nr:DUF1361 domain-containing protein [Candidatus Izemoplasmatales bacterium]
MTKKQLFNHFMIFLVFVILSVLVFTIVDRGIHFMLAWNAFLAFIPVVMVYLFSRYKNKPYISMIIFLVWLFFYPNSIYLITDLIYLNQDAFMQDEGMYQGLLYLQDFNAYFGFFHIFLGAMYGVVLALSSFKYFYQYFKEKYHYIHIFFFIFLPVLVSVGIYLGRFLRLNTWNLLNPYNVMREFFTNINGFTFVYIGLFSLIQYIIFSFYFLYKKQIL